MLLALAILAMTIGLIRAEAARDLQTLTAAGATSSARRTLAAATAGALALLGAVLGLLGAYVGLIAGYQDDLSPLAPIPILNLSVVIVGLPIVAAVVAWLLGGREPSAIARQALD
jgi:putative ABC transport system permease protein